MNDLDRYLLPTEAPVVLVRRHWASLISAAATALAILLAGFFVLRFIGNVPYFDTVGVCVLVCAIAWFGWVVGEWYVERFVITDKRVLLINGLTTRRVAIMPLSKVTDLTYERSIAGRMLGYGVFVMESAGQNQALSRIDFLPKPDALYRDVSTLLFGPRTSPAGPGQDDPDGNHPTTPIPRLR